MVPSCTRICFSESSMAPPCRYQYGEDTRYSLPCMQDHTLDSDSQPSAALKHPRRRGHAYPDLATRHQAVKIRTFKIPYWETVIPSLKTLPQTCLWRPTKRKCDSVRELTFHSIFQVPLHPLGGSDRSCASLLWQLDVRI